MKIAICDDCREDAMRLKALLSEHHDAVLYSSANRLLNAVQIQKKRYDLYLIDIYLDTGSGLELAEQLRPDMVLTDIKMPFMDGLELCRRLRQSLPAAKLVVFSGFDDFY